jgi:hypothetical protein
MPPELQGFDIRIPLDFDVGQGGKVPRLAEN